MVVFRWLFDKKFELVLIIDIGLAIVLWEWEGRGGGGGGGGKGWHGPQIVPKEIFNVG